MSTKLFFTVLFATVLAISCTNPTEEGPQVFHGTGKILAVDAEKGTVTIDHGEIKGLMSAMTMDFDAKDKKILENIDVGDQVKFSLSKFGEDIDLVSIRRQGEKTISGAKIYLESCARCHGERGEGKKKGIPLIEGHALEHSKEDFLKQVRMGGEDMPAFDDKLSEKEIAAVVDYVRDQIQKGLRKDEESKHDHK
ncbi:MAG: hypothetical protein HKN33_11215 [Pyrinomonadaceae bacterium]|nr:hypothetical protein [Pyrinomonadaceae bacterium]